MSSPRRTSNRSRYTRPAMLLLTTAMFGTFLALMPLPAVLTVPELDVEHRTVVLQRQAEATTLDGRVPESSQSGTLDNVEVATSHDPATLAAAAAEPDRKSSGPTDATAFDTIGVTVPAELDRPVLVRVRDSGGWQAWKSLAIDADEGPDRGSSEDHGSLSSAPFWVRHAEAFEVSVPPAAGDSVDVSLVRETGRTITVEAPADPAAHAVLPNQPPIIPRSAWGAAPPHEPYEYQNKAVMGFVHHSVSANDYGPNEVAGIMRSIQIYHQDTNDWNDFAYNFAVDRFGRTWEGRGGGIDKVFTTAHARGFNEGTIGVVMLGEYGSASPTPTALQAVGTILGWKLAMSGTDPSGTATYVTAGNERFDEGEVVVRPVIVGHRDTGATACPGQLLYDQLATIRAAAKTTYQNNRGPIGYVESWSTDLGSVHVTGWTIDFDTKDPIDFAVFVDGILYWLGPADAGHAGVGEVYPALGTPHGFVATIDGLSGGSHHVCVDAFNVGPGTNTRIDCRTLTLPSSSPLGVVESWRASPGAIHATGWAIDPDTYDPIDVEVLVDGVVQATVPAEAGHAGVGVVYPPWGTPHGFAARVDGIAPGPHQVCVRALNIGAGADTSVGCRTLATPSGSPVGVVDSMTKGANSVRVTGWMIDPDTADAIPVQVYIDGVLMYVIAADKGHAGLIGVFPDYGTAHGFNEVIATTPGAHSVCVYATNEGAGLNTLLQCRLI